MCNKCQENNLSYELIRTFKETLIELGSCKDFELLG